MPAKKTVEDSITRCAGTCGGYVYPKKIEAAVARAAAESLHGEGVLVRASTGRDLCAQCRRDIAPYPSTVTVGADPSEAELARKAKVAAERLAAAEKVRLTLLAQRAARAKARMAKPVSMGQSMVRI